MVIVLLLASVVSSASAADWHGYEKSEFTVDGVNGYVVMPRKPAAGKPWLWRARFPEYHPDHALALLAKGFHVAYYDQANIFGSPKAMAQWDLFYEEVRKRFGLARKVTLEGVSRGGLFVYNWARRHPDLIDAVYCESPVCDMKSWPGGKGSGLGSKKDWQQALESYEINEAQMLAWRENPVDFVAALAPHHIPILHIVNEYDRVVPPTENTALFAARYREAGGPITVHWNTSSPSALYGHHFPIDDTAMVVDFVLRNTPGMQHLAGTGMTPHGVEYYKLREGLRNSLARFQAGGPARIAFLGGSITNMIGWRDQVCTWIRKRFPQSAIECVNAGIPSTGSTPGAFRLSRDVFGKGAVDLLFEEAAVNDESNGFTAREQLRGMEGIVRQARLRNPRLDIVLMHFVDPSKITSYRAGHTPQVITAHEQVATHYGLPSLNLAREVTDRIDADEFDWDHDFKNLHPSPFGQHVYSRSMIRMLEDAWAEPQSAQTRDYLLPPPIDERSYFRGHFVSVSEARCDAGWKVDPSWKPADKAGTRPGFVDVPMLVTESPGGECRFEFEGTGVGVFAVSGPDAGILEASVDGAPYTSIPVLTRWSPSLHLTWAMMLNADLPEGKHVLRFRSKAGALRIAHFLVN